MEQNSNNKNKSNLPRKEPDERTNEDNIKDQAWMAIKDLKHHNSVKLVFDLSERYKINLFKTYFEPQGYEFESQGQKKRQNPNTLNLETTEEYIMKKSEALEYFTENK